MPVPLLDVNAQNLPLEAELTSAFSRVLRSGMFIQGPEVEAFERECAELVGAKHGVGCSSGTDAILLALMALGIGPGDEVLVPSFTFFATAGCVSRTGAIPVFVDSCPGCFNIDVTKAAAKITPRTKAIMPVHLFGQSADMDAVMKLAAEHGLKVIEDGAQAIGAHYKGRGVGSMGDFGTYSFFPSKNLGGFGDGGMLVTNDDDLAEHARILRVHGSKPKYFHKHVGANFRLDPLQAAMLRVKLARYDSYTVGRQSNASDYTDKLLALKHVAQVSLKTCVCENGTADSVNDDPPAADTKILLPKAKPDHGHIWNQFTLRVLGAGNRDALKNHLMQQGIGCEIYYPVTMDQQECFQYTSDFARSNCEVAHQLAGEVLSIPIYPELSEDQRNNVVGAIASFLS